ncbi:MAG: hypothetical protein JO208_10965 [Alphaproteobacteria bacterium]|nr:hypothetical protein [Alphaproteobacteria bacterium]
MWRLIGGTVAGVVAWFVTVTILNMGLRYGWHDYAAVEKAMTFTLPMMLARLSESGVSSILSGAIAAAVARNRHAALYAGLVLLLFFLPVHYMLFSKFPLWYHLVFLASLPLLSVLGGQLVRERSAAAQPA